MEHSLAGKAVVVTGGFGSLGTAVAEVLIEQGARVALLDYASAPREGMVGAAPAGVIRVGNVDLRNAQAAKDAMANVESKLGGLSGLVNVAGGFRWESISDGNGDTWDLMFEMNVKTALNASKAAIPYLLRGNSARIVNIGAGAGVKAGFGMGAYSASKAGVARLTEALAEELKDNEVTVNAILPAIIDTPQNRADMPGADFGRWVSPKQIGLVIAFLLSSSAAAITGALIPVTGRT